jgi:ubiquinone/menaquinone biosynthesis C-methylase UbiE
MSQQQDIAFDYGAEREYYYSAVTDARPYHHLSGHLMAFGADCKSLFAGKRVLDFGGGEGLHSKLIAETCEPESVVVVDLFLHRMLVPAQLNPFDSLNFVCGDCFRLPFSSGSFDTVFGSGILHHFRDLDGAVSEVRRVLRHPGRYLGIEPNFRSPLVHLVRMRHHKSRNEYEPHVDLLEAAFVRQGFRVKAKFFWRRFPGLKWGFLTPTVALSANTG